jgi:hypothetical protein
MAFDKIHTHSGITFNATTVGGITRQNIRDGKQIGGVPTSGEPYIRHQAFRRAGPGASFTTLCLQDALDQCGALGLKIANLPAGLVAYGHAHEEGSTRKAGATHRKFVIAKGMIIPTTLRAVVAVNEDATLDYDALGTSTDANNPMIETDTISLPSVTDNERFALGPATIESILLEEIQSIDITFGITVGVRYSQAYLWPCYASIVDVRPIIDFRGLNIEWLKSDMIPRTGKVITHANTTIYLRKRAEGGSFVANGTEEHIKLTANGLAHVITPMDSSGDAAECSIHMECNYDGTNAPIVIDTTSAIT